jgi:hypothetical protein
MEIGSPRQQLIGVIVFLSLMSGGVFFMQDEKIKKLEQNEQVLLEKIYTLSTQVSEPAQVQAVESTTVAPVTAVENTPAPMANISGQTKDIEIQTPQPDPNVAIHFTVKDSEGKVLKNILCEVTTDNKTKTKMIVVDSKKTDAKGNCFFEKLDATKAYLVRVYWTTDKSRNSNISLGFIPAGTAETREVIKPSDM